MSSEASKPNIFTPPASIDVLYAATAGNQFASINRPTAGSREEKELESGTAPLQLYSLGTPNGKKVTILLEELAELNLAQYDAWTINIGKGEQFTSGFTKVNPNGKIPALVDKEGPDGSGPLHLFER
jgi:GST-like protein